MAHMPVPGDQAVDSLLPSVGFTLDSINTATILAAGGLRLMRASYTGPAIRVRNSSNVAIDIGFNAAGDLDTVALAAHVGSGNGWVTVWYDQSGNGRHVITSEIETALTITDGSLQPLIMVAGVLQKIGTNPALRFTGTQMLQASGIAFPATASGAMLHQADDGVNVSDLYVMSLGHSSTPHYDPIRHNQSTKAQQFNYSPSSGPTTLITVQGAAQPGLPLVQSFRDDGTNARIFSRGAQIGTGSITRGGTAPNKLQIGARYTTTVTRGYQGLIASFVFATTDQPLTNVIADYMLDAGLL